MMDMTRSIIAMIIIGVAALLIIIVLMIISVNYVLSSKKKEDEKIRYSRRLMDELKICLNQTTNEGLKDAISVAIDSIKYSDPITNNSTSDIENKLSDRVAQLMEFIRGNKREYSQLIEEINELIAEKNVITLSTK